MPLFTTWFTEYLKFAVETCCSEKDFFQNIDNVLGQPRALMTMCNEMNVVSMPANTTAILQTMEQGVLSTSKSYYLRNLFYKAIAAMYSDSSADLDKVNGKPSGNDSLY